MIFSKKQKKKTGSDQTAGCAGWSAPLLFANPEDTLSRVEAHFIICHFNALATVTRCPIGKRYKFAAVCFVI